MGFSLIVVRNRVGLANMKRLALMLFSSVVCMHAHVSAQHTTSSLELSSAGPQKSVAEPTTTVLVEQGQAAFDEVWQTVVDRIWNDDFDLASWEAARQELRPQLSSASSIVDVRRILRDLIATLGQSHYSIIPGEVYADFDSEDISGGWKGEAGIQVRIIDGCALVSKVTIDSDAYRQGIRPGWEITAIRGSDTQKLILGLNASLTKHSGYRPETMASLMIEARLNNGSAKSVDLECTSPDGLQHGLKIRLHKPTGVRVQFGYLPTVYVNSESREVKPGVGYVRFNAFFAPDNVMQTFEEAEQIATRGLLIDLRGNAGGLAGMTMGIANRLVPDTEERRQLGIQTMKGAKINYVLIPGAQSYLQPVAVLIDECSISSAEILAAGLQALGRARVFGQRSAGAALPSMVKKLPNGDYFQFAVADFVDVSGRRVEGIGVQPDEVTRLTKSDLVQGIDPALDAAVAWIESQTAVNENRSNSR